jgi:hypothetical protein
MALVMNASENCCVNTMFSGQSTWTRVAKWKKNVGTGGACGSYGKKALNCQYVEGMHLHRQLSIVVSQQP